MSRCDCAECRARAATSAGPDAEALQTLLYYCDAADDSRYGTLSSSMVRQLVIEAITPRAAPAAVPALSERAAFEAWCAEHQPDWNLGIDTWALSAWSAWQARAALSDTWENEP